MKVTRIYPDEAGSDPVLAISLIHALGSENLANQVLASLSTTLPASHCTVFGLRSNGRMEAVTTASAVGEAATIAAVDYLRMGFDKQDSNTRWLIKRKPSKQRQFWIGHQFAVDVENDIYRRICYEEPGIRERLSLLCGFPNGYRISLSLYRNHSYPDFSDADFIWLALQAPLLAAAVLRHIEISPRSIVADRTEKDIMHVLSARERQLIAHILEGLTTKEAAAEMGISVTTALTYRYRAFQNLGIRTSRDLLTLVRNSSIGTKRSIGLP